MNGSGNFVNRSRSTSKNSGGSNNYRKDKSSHRPALIECLRKRIIIIIIRLGPTPGVIIAELTQLRAETGTRAQNLAKNTIAPAVGTIIGQDHILTEAQGQGMAQDKTKSDV